MENKDHITLNLPISSGPLSNTIEDLDSNNSNLLPRKSLKRTWNQLSRCQRNFIVLGAFIVFFTTLIVLHDTDSTTSFLRSYSNSEHSRIPLDNSNKSPLKSNSDRDLQSADGVLLGTTVTKINEPRIEKINSNSLDFKLLGLDRPLGPKLNINKKPNQIEDEIAKVINKNEHVQINPNINIHELDLNEEIVGLPKSTNLQDKSTELEVLRTKIKELIGRPAIMPAINEMPQTIDDFIKDLVNPKDAQKQHFHGANNERQEAVVDAFKHSWAGYKKFAWGHDNLKPISQVGHDWFGLGLTIVDSLDTMYIMGLEDEFQEATDWVREHLTFDVSRDVNLFEVTIRVLGGLLSAYHLSGDKLFLEKSLDLGNRLLPCFLTPSGIPYSDVNLADRSAHAPKWSPDSSTSEVTTIQLEFRDLSRSTNYLIYEKIAHHVNEKVHSLEKNKGLVPIFINAHTGTFRNYATISLGARGDSYYEYLLKQWIQTGRRDDDFLILDYMRSIDGVLTELMRRTPKQQHVFIGELVNGKDFKPKMDHLTCYLPGTLILGHHFGMPDSHLLLARDLLDTCYQTYITNPTSLAPEISYFAVTDNEEQDIYVKPNDAHNLLRPEFIESLYYFYALTGNRTYQEMGWKIFKAFDTHTKVAAGFTSIGNVKDIYNTRLRDMMESFWLGETLKYFYLLFSDNPKEIDLEKWVFNTEAHPLPIRSN